MKNIALRLYSLLQTITQHSPKLSAYQFPHEVRLCFPPEVRERLSQIMTETHIADPVVLIQRCLFTYDMQVAHTQKGGRVILSHDGAIEDIVFDPVKWEEGKI